ncbi:DNA replication terminus site-binding protein [Pseudomonas baltica]|uniref:DNA replication terminus site-binding protein n=1 Tax=Pseudomonas baltica TaxID=2762576 RepID=A0A7X1G2G7_9PSED|nr:DNA replication terminus site-binding protein [Pseudomonas baltica]MBC2677232.1 hypothetical protein [Pseudomonas baltica]
MDLHLSQTSAAIAMVNRLQAELTDLGEVLRTAADHVRVDAMFGLDFRPEDAVRNEPIEVRVLEGDEAVQAAFEALTSIWVKVGQHPRETLRVPGAIALPRTAIDKILQTNATRVELGKLIGAIDKTNDRRNVWNRFKGSGNGIVPKQALRLTNVLTAPSNINFYWDDTGSSGARKMAGDLLQEWHELLDQYHDKQATVHHSSEAAAENALVYGIDMLGKLDPQEQVAIRRLVQPHIRARVRNGDSKVKPIIAPVPFVYETGIAPPKIKPLSSYEPKVVIRKNTRLALLEEEPYVEAMNLYRYKDRHRVYGPLQKKSAEEG